MHHYGNKTLINLSVRLFASKFCSSSFQGYLKALGMARTAEVKRDARIGEAEARRDAQIREAIAEEQRMASRFLNDTEIAKAQRDFELKKAAYDVEVQTKVRPRFFILLN